MRKFSILFLVALSCSSIVQAEPRNCNDAWTAYVASNPAGQDLKYNTTIKTTVDGNVILNQSGTRETIVLSSSAVQVETNTITNGNSVTSTITKDEFIKVCNQGQTPGTGAPGYTFAIVEQSRKTITVPAGTFDCNYVKIQMTPTASAPQGAGPMVMETWSTVDAVDPIQVQSIVSTTMQSSGQTMVNIITVELVSRR